MKSEIVIFNGIRFYRYPESTNPAHRKYFRPNVANSLRGYQALHQEVWKSVHGPIPPGMHIHHEDGDYNNNTLENLVAVPELEHRRHHGRQDRTQAQKDQLESIRGKAAAWHRSEEGRKWHTKHAQESIVNLAPITKVCAWCKQSYETTCHRANVKFCTPQCREKERATHRKKFDKICAVCEAPFQTAQKKTQTCSRKCSRFLY